MSEGGVALEKIDIYCNALIQFKHVEATSEDKRAHPFEQVTQASVFERQIIGRRAEDCVKIKVAKGEFKFERLVFQEEIDVGVIHKFVHHFVRRLFGLIVG